MDATSGPVINLELFESENFNVDNYVKKIASESIYASNIIETKEKLSRSAQQTAEEIKQSVYKNYANFMETAKEVGHLEGKMTQLRQSLEEQRKLLTIFKNLNVNVLNVNDSNFSDSKSLNSSSKSSLAILLEQVEGCGLITQKPGRNLLFHSDLEALHLDDYSVSHKLHAYLLSDALLLTLPQRKRNKTNFNVSNSAGLSSSANRLINNPLMSNGTGKSVESSLTSSNASSNTYQYKFQAFYELQDVKIMNIDDSKEVRNSFQLLKFPESLAFRCANAHLKKEWLENIENAKKQLQLQMDIDRAKKLETPVSDSSSTNNNHNNTIHEEDENEDEIDGMRKQMIGSPSLANISEYERNKILRELFSDFDILLAQRDFEKAVDMLLKIKQPNANSKPSASNNNSNLDAVQQLIYKQKETELINILRKDLITSKERGNNKGVVKTGKRVVNSLIRLKIYDEAIDLFIDYHKHLNAETLRKIKLEESNAIYMNNVLNLFFENLRNSYGSFREAFSNLINYCYSSYISWCDTEIEILIKKLQSQHYLGRHFDLTIENCELIFIKATEFSYTNNFEVKYLFETKLSPILEASLKEQQDILIDASLQRSKLELEDSPANNEQNRQVQIEKLISDLKQLQLIEFFTEKDLNSIRSSSSASLQFTRGVINFFYDCLKVYYQDINFFIVETFTKLFKLELKIYTSHLAKAKDATSKNVVNAGADSSNESTKKTSTRLKKQDIYFNVCCIEKIFSVIEQLYFDKTGIHSKFFHKVAEKIAKFKEDNFV